MNRRIGIVLLAASSCMMPACDAAERVSSSLPQLPRFTSDPTEPCCVYEPELGVLICQEPPAPGCVEAGDED